MDKKFIKLRPDSSSSSSSLLSTLKIATRQKSWGVDSDSLTPHTKIGYKGIPSQRIAADWQLA